MHEETNSDLRFRRVSVSASQTYNFSHMHRGHIFDLGEYEGASFFNRPGEGVWGSGILQLSDVFAQSCLVVGSFKATQGAALKFF